MTDPLKFRFETIAGAAAAFAGICAAIQPGPVTAEMKKNAFFPSVVEKQGGSDQTIIDLYTIISAAQAKHRTHLFGFHAQATALSLRFTTPKARIVLSSTRKAGSTEKAKNRLTIESLPETIDPSKIAALCSHLIPQRKPVADSAYDALVRALEPTQPTKASDGKPD